LIIPLSSGGQVNGKLAFRFNEERTFDPEELEIARALATQASLAIQLTRLAKAPGNLPFWKSEIGWLPRSMIHGHSYLCSRRGAPAERRSKHRTSHRPPSRSCAFEFVIHHELVDPPVSGNGLM
jgi:GAF domain